MTPSPQDPQPSPRRGRRFLLLSGGAFRGAVQVWVIHDLMLKHQYDGIFGVSVGSLNGVMAAQHRISDLISLWEGVDGIGAFLSFRWWGFFTDPIYELMGEGRSGAYSMAPLQRLLDKYVKRSDVKIPYRAGFVSAETGKYYHCGPEHAHSDEQLRAWIEASCCMVPIMVPPLVSISGKEEIGIDGGYKNIFPVPTVEDLGGEDALEGVHFDVVACTPLNRIHREVPRKLNSIVEIGVRGVEIMEAEVFENDLQQIASLLRAGGTADVYAPSFDTGPSFRADRDTIAARLRESKRMVGNPELRMTSSSWDRVLR